jgi:hypothetical protein
MSTPRTLASQPLRTLRSIALACTLPAFAVACSGAADTMAPYSAIDGGVRLALVNETGAGMVCGTDAPVTASLTTVDRRGRTVAAAGVLVNFRVTDGVSQLFAGSSITNAAGLASDRVTVGVTPGKPLTLEVRSVEAGTGVATTHLALTRPVLMSPNASLTSQAALLGVSTLANGVAVTTGCTRPDGSDAVLPAGTPATFVLPDGSVRNGIFDGQTPVVYFIVPAGMVGQTYTVTVGNATTGTLTGTFTIRSTGCVGLFCF